jgi:putative two-component system response regulator
MNAAVSQRLPIVLVVDDEERIVQLFEEFLHSKGYATLAARSGREALALAAEKKPDLIILGAIMPDIDGFETVARLKADPVTRPVPVIMVTARNEYMMCGAFWRKNRIPAWLCLSTRVADSQPHSF